MTGTLLLAASLVLLPVWSTAQPAAAQRLTTSVPLSLLDVPYLSQSEALCGGAAAAMVLRYWGASGVTAEDFAPLVDRSRSGIETSVLASAVEARGYLALPASGTAAMVQRELADGRPVIALLQDRPGTFHYVVVVGWHARAIVVHDPARTPYVLMHPDEFERRWKQSNNWMLAVAPARSPASESRLGVPARSLDSESQLGVRAANGCEALVADGVRLAQERDLPAAERLLADAAYQCAGAAPLRELAGVRLLQRRWPEVRDLAGRAVEIDPADAHAWQLLATARYIGGDQAGALDAWNHAGAPVVEIVSVSGLQRTPHRIVEQRLGVDAGAVLTRSSHGRADRRLEELPAAALTRLEYVPRGSGTVELRAHVVERSVVPRGRLTWAAMGLRAAALREVGVAVAGLGHGGERLDGTWRFWPHRPAASVALHTPSTLGVLSIELSSERQPFDDAAIPDVERLSSHASLADWATESLRWEVRAGFSRWRGTGSFGTFGGSTHVERGRGRVSTSVDAWLGDRSFAAGQLHGGWRSSAQRRGFVLEVSGALETVGGGAPLDIWPAADTGHARRPLLRAHPVLDDGRLRVERLGRHLAQTATEAQYWWRGAGGVPFGGALFVDAALGTGRPTVSASSHSTRDVDAGVGFRLALPGRGGTFRADVAHGLRDGRNAFSLGWTPR